MGEFVAISGVMGGSQELTASALRDFALENDGGMAEVQLTTNDDSCLVIAAGKSGVTVLYPYDFSGWDESSAYLSMKLQKPVFSFHIHDGDFWIYRLFENGEVVDQFNPIPDYWGDVDDEERQSWRGNAAAVASRVPGIAPEDIANYLVEWDDELIDESPESKAYPSDKSPYGEDRQMVDFLTKLGLKYLEHGTGMADGLTYRFDCTVEETD